MSQVIAGRFELRRRAGEGAMGRVWEARDLTDGATVAIKLVHEGVRGERFDREATVLAELEHPRIVRYLAHGTSDAGDRYLAMEWLPGISLADELGRRTLEAWDTVMLARAVAEGLAAAHAAGVVHRDLKPSNLMLVDGDLARVKIVDFGLARRWASPSITTTGQVFGTPAYMSPEQVRGQGQIDTRADVFSLGCILYECLTGSSPFAAGSIPAVFGKILYAEVPPAATHGIPVPPRLDDLLGCMLAADRDARPRDGQALLRALDSLELLHDAPGERMTRALSSRERRFACVLLGPSARLDTAATLADSAPNDDLSGIETLPDGSLVGIFRDGASPADLAVRCARRALDLHDLYPDLALAIALGHAELSHRYPVGEGIDRAAALPVVPGAIVLDDPTAALLAGRFVIEGAPGPLRLVAEKPAASARGPAAAPLLGRDRELLLLEENIAQAVEDGQAVVSMVLGPPGIGKSRLGAELVARAAARWPGLAIWQCAGDVVRAGSPLALARDLLAGALGLRGAGVEEARDRLRARVLAVAPPADAPRLCEFLGELAGVPFPDEASAPLRAARGDRALMAAQTLAAFVEWIGHEEAAHPVLLVIDDLHWGDRATGRLLEAARSTWSDRRLALVALARPEVSEIFPTLWTGEGGHVLNLGGLSRKAAARIVHARLDAGVAEEEVARIVDRGEGNAFLLEELARAARSGERAAPASVVGLLHARLEALAPEARRVLRAASIFGERFWRGGVAALVDLDAAELDRWLVELDRHEIVGARAQSRFADEPEHAFRHALLRDAAYALLTAADRTLGHRLAGEWLSGAGEREPAVLAEHFEAGGRPEVASAAWAAAAENALAASELDAARAYGARGLACAPPRDVEVRLRTALAEACYFASDLPGFAAQVGPLLELEPIGTPAWFRMVGVIAFPADDREDRARELGRLLLEVEETEDPPPARVVAEARVAGCLFSFGAHRMAEKLITRAERWGAAIASREPSVAAELAWPRGMLIDDPALALPYILRAHAAYKESGNARSVAIQRANLGEVLGALGAYDEGIAIMREAEARCRELRIPKAAAIARLAAAVTALSVDAGEASLNALRAAMEERHFPAGVVPRAQVHEARALLAAGQLGPARALAASSAEEPSARAGALAVQAAIDLIEGKTAAALSASGEALQLAGAGEAIGFADAYVKMVRAEALLAAGLRDDARALLAAAAAHIHDRASRLEEPRHRESYLGAVPEHARIVSLLGELDG